MMTIVQPNHIRALKPLATQTTRDLSTMIFSTFDFCFLSICISVYLGVPLSPTATRAKSTSRSLKSLIWSLKSLIWSLKSLAVAKVHTLRSLKSTPPLLGWSLKSTPLKNEIPSRGWHLRGYGNH